MHHPHTEWKQAVGFFPNHFGSNFLTLLSSKFDWALTVISVLVALKYTAWHAFLEDRHQRGQAACTVQISLWLELFCALDPTGCSSWADPVWLTGRWSPTTNTNHHSHKTGFLNSIQNQRSTLNQNPYFQGLILTFCIFTQILFCFDKVSSFKMKLCSIQSNSSISCFPCILMFFQVRMKWFWDQYQTLCLSGVLQCLMR